jgi:pyruvate dehydrogenase E2 component (dihydrolipoamide acetyltransferase)
MPEVAANAAEAVLQEWQVAVNSPFSARDSIATVETEKAVVDIEAEADGVLLKTLVAAGAQVEVGAAIAVLGAPGERVDDVEGLLDKLGLTPGAPVVAPERRLVADDPEGGTANTGTQEADPRTGTSRAERRTSTSGAERRTPAARGNGGELEPRRVFTSPLARRLAREAGLRVEDIPGTGPGGRIVRKDVEEAIAAAESSLPASPTVAPTAAPELGDSATPYTDVPHSRMRAAIASRLTGSKQTVPHFYVRATVNVGELLDMRATLNEGGQTRISVNDLVVKAAARAHRLVPAMNAMWTPEAVRLFDSVDIAVAVATDRGLVTPVLRGVDQLSISTVAAASRDLAQRAQTGQLRQEELEGGTLCVTNLGMFDVEEFAAIINPPQSAILAVGAARPAPVVVQGELTVGTLMHLTLSVDHRPIDGTLAAEWIKTFVCLLEKPVLILA